MANINYGYEQIREHYQALLELQKVFCTDQKSEYVEGSLVAEYEAYLKNAELDLPGLMAPFNKTDYFGYNSGLHAVFYRADGIKANIGRNIGKLKSKLDYTEKTPITETRSFHFIDNEKLREILIRDDGEIQNNIVVRNWKSAIILIGACIEAILLDLVQKNETQVRTSQKAPKESDILKWDLSELIEVCVDTKLVGAEVGKLSHSAVREYRNLIHPGAEIRTGLKIEPEEAKIALEVFNILVRELSR